MVMTIEKVQSLIGADNMPVEIKPLDNSKFLQVKETLTRIGFPQTIDGEKVLWQTCHILQKRGRYFITHFKHMYLFDGRTKSTALTDDDVDRTLVVAKMLENWGLVEILNPSTDTDLSINVKVVRYDERDAWNLKPKYHNKLATKKTNEVNA